MHKNNPIRLYIIAAAVILIFSAAASYAVIRLRQPDYVREYSDIQIIDIHNHDASHYFKSLFVWRKFSIEQIVLFGDISSSDAQETDKLAWKAYYKHPGLFYPFIAGVDTYNDDCLAYVKQNLELGCYGVGEIVTASQLSPMAADQEWKAENPLDGYLPELYELCAEYNAPLLVHIDPPSQRNIYIFEKSLSLYPDTLFILAHGNVYNSCDLLMELLAKHDNLYIDLFVGFSENPECTETLDDYVRMINSYPDRIMVSSDSAYAITYEQAYRTMYELFARLDDAAIEKIAHENFEGIISRQMITDYQIGVIEKICDAKGIEASYLSFTKKQANEFIISNS